MRSLASLLAHLPEVRRIVSCPAPTAFTDMIDATGAYDERLELPGQQRPRLAARASASLTLAIVAFRHRHDLAAIHANGLAEQIVILPAVMVSRVPVVVWVHDWEVSPRAKRLAPILRVLMPRATLAAVSEEARDMLKSAGIGVGRDIEVVANPIDPAEVAAERRDPVGDVVTVGYVGTPAHYKGFHLLPALIEQLAEDPVRWIIFARPESGMPEVWRQLERLPAGRVELAERVVDVRLAYGRCDVVLCPSLNESFGRVVAEAMANGLPVVASDLPPIRRLLGDNEAGLLVAPGDVSGIARALRRLLKDRNLRDRLGVAGRRRVKSYAPDPIAAAMTQLYGLPRPINAAS
jgi:glycosyltransferase involved in cell wall biosynthesis